MTRRPAAARGLPRARRARPSAGGSSSTSASPPASARPTACSRRRTRCSKRGVDVVLGFVETHGRAETAALLDGLEAGAAPAHRVPRRRRSRRWTSTPSSRASPQVAVVDEIAHTNVPGCAQPQALPGRARAARRRHQRHRRLQHPAPREPERPRRARHRRASSARPCPTASSSRPIRSSTSTSRSRICSSGCAPARSTPPDKVEWALEHFFQEDEPLDAARAGAARGGREPRAHERRAGADATGASARRAPRGRVMVCMSSYPPRARDAAAPRLAHGGPAQHRLVRGLRRDARRGAGPHRRRGAAAPARQHRAGARARRRGACGCRRADPVAGAPRLRALARRRRTSSIGRSHQPWWRQLLGPLGRRSGMVREADGLRPAHRLARRARSARMTLAHASSCSRRCRSALALVADRRRRRPRPRPRSARGAAGDPRGQLPQRARRAAHEGGASSALDSAALLRSSAGSASAAAAQIDRHARSASSASCAVQEGNITEPGEAEATARAARSAGTTTAQRFAQLRAAGDPAAAAQLYFARARCRRFAPCEAARRRTSSTLNQDAMVRKSDARRARGASA